MTIKISLYICMLIFERIEHTVYVVIVTSRRDACKVTIHNCRCLQMMHSMFVWVCCDRERQTVNTCLAKAFGPNAQRLSDTAHAQHYFLHISPQDLCYFTLTTTLDPSTDKPEHTSWQVPLLHIQSTCKHTPLQSHKHWTCSINTNCLHNRPSFLSSPTHTNA